MNKFALFFIILIIACSGGIASDIYAPSLPAISQSLSTNINTVQFSMAIYLFGMAFGQIIYGPISEGVGRKPPLYVGLALLLIGSIICVFAQSINVLIFGRIIQGFGAGATTSLWRSMFRDLFTGTDLAKYGSYLAIGVTFIIPAAPMLGGYLQHYIGWRSIFLFLIFYSTALLFITKIYLPETSNHHHPEKLRWSFLKSSAISLLTSRVFLKMTSIASLIFGAYFSWFIIAPVLLIKHLGLSPVNFGWINFLGGVIGFGVGGFLNGRLVGKLGSAVMLRLGFSILMLAGLAMFFGYEYAPTNLPLIIIPMYIAFLGCTFIFSNTFAAAFTPFGHIAGITAAIYSFLQTCGGAVTGSLISHISTDNQLTMSIILIASSIIAWWIFDCIASKSNA